VPPSSIDKQIDELYQLSPDEFTAARNALAKTAGADDKAAVRALRKPSMPAWAVNQLYWRSRPTWDALIRSAEQLRDAHRSAMSGHATDLRKADASHRDALSQALKETMALAAGGGHEPNAAVKEAIMRTLQALPADIVPGRLDAPLESAGFGVLEGVPASRPKLRIVEKKPSKAAPAKTGGRPRGKGEPTDPAAERKRAQEEERRARVEAEREAKRVREEAERQRREQERLAARKAQKIMRLTAAVERAKKHEDDLREKLIQAEKDRLDAERELQRARRE
jgi:hypothetical protein